VASSTVGAAWCRQHGELVTGSGTTGSTQTALGGSGASAGVGELLDSAPLSVFHRRAVLVSGVGFFTDAYDLFVISTVAALAGAQWHLDTTETSWLAGSAILGAFVGALVFGRLAGPGAESVTLRLSLVGLLRTPRLVRLVVATAGCWFVFDYAYYGNTLSLPVILHGVDPRADLVAKLAWSLGMFAAFAVPGYALGVWRMDRIGHRRLQLIGFAVLAGCFLLLGAVPVLTTSIAAFVAVFGLSYFFVEFGPNMTTFVLPSEVFPVAARATGHGIAAGLGKLGAFLGVFFVPELEARIGLRAMLGVAAGFAIAGVLLTRLLPEPAGRALEDVSADVLTGADPTGDSGESRPVVPDPDAESDATATGRISALLGAASRAR